MWSVIGYVPSFTTIILSPNSPNIEFYSDPVWLKRVNLPSLVAPILIVIRTYKIYTAVGINESGNFNVHYYDFFTGCFCNVVDFLWCTTRGRFPRDMSETLCLLEFRWTSQRFMCREAIKHLPICLILQQMQVASSYVYRRVSLCSAFPSSCTHTVKIFV